jgi:chemotaxis protein CheZ
MGEPRKVFRIEEIAAWQRTARADETISAPGYAEIMQELRALRALVAPSLQSVANGSQRVAVERLTSALALVRNVLCGAQPERPDSSGRVPTSRIGHELEAVSKDSEVATQKILAAAEDIDQAADNLAAALKDGIDRGLAQDIRDRVVQIFEACNFQDLTSQRVTKVIKALKEIEAEIASALAEIVPGGRRAGGRGTAPRKRPRSRLAARYRHPVRPRLVPGIIDARNVV